MVDSLLTSFDPNAGLVEGGPLLERRLSDLSGYFADQAAFEQQLAEADPVVYTVSSVQPAEGAGQLHYGIGKIAPGRIGDEFFMTKGHFHEWRPAAEFYIGLRGDGAMLLEDEASRESRLLPLLPNGVARCRRSAALGGSH